MTAIDHLLGEFIDAWNAGRRPSARDYLERIPAGAERDELAERLSDWLQFAPTPAYDEAARARIRAEPAVTGVLDAARAEAGALPDVLPRLRARAGLSRGDVAAQLLQRFGLNGGDEARATAYVERLERGELGPTRLSRRLLDALGDLLGASGATLAAAASLGRGAAGPAAAGGMLFRATGDAGDSIAADIDALSRAAFEPAPSAMDDLDRLFLGGPEA